MSNNEPDYLTPLVPIKVPSISRIMGKCWMRLGKKEKASNNKDCIL